MPVLPLLLVLASCLDLPWPPPPAGLGAGGAVLLSVLVSAVPVLAAAGLSRWVARTLAADPARRPEVLRRYVRDRRRLSFVLLAASAGVLTGCGWGWAVWNTLTFDRGDGPVLLPGAEAAVPLPYFLMLVGCWAVYHRAELALHRTAPQEVAARPFWTLPGYVLFHLRQLVLVVLLPLVAWALVLGLKRVFPETVRTPGFQTAMAVGGLLTYLTLPRLVKPLLGLKAMPPGPVRNRLAATARRVDCRLTDLLVWPTPGAVANALAVGVTPWARYVVVTDRLLDHLSGDELVAVFGHEAGHLNRNHVPFYMAFFALSSALGAVGWVGLAQLAARQGWATDGGPGWLAGPAILLACGYVFVVFGLVSRRCERQADVYGARAGSCGDPFCDGHTDATDLPPGDRHVCRTGVRALQRALAAVATANGADARESAGVWGRAWARVRAWQHGPVADRTAFLQKLADDPALGDRTDADTARFRWLVLGGLAAAVAVAGWAVGWAEVAAGL
jgi:Zn-dependent protease with chaperone function